MEGMKGKARMLALAVLAVLALGAVGAQGAMADPLFRSDEAHTFVSGSQQNTHVFEAGTGNKVECEVALFAGTSTSTATGEMTIVTVYDDCTAFGFANAHVEFNSCDYQFTSTTGNGEDVHLNCGGDDTVEITPTIFGFSVCTVHVFEGTFEAIDYDNVANGDVQVTAAATGISYEETGSGCGVGSGNDGTYTGDTTLAGVDTDNNPVDIEVG